MSTNVVLPTSSGAVLVGTNGSGLHRSPDGGASWQRGRRRTGRHRLLPGARADALYAGTADEGVWQSTDDGATWTPVDGGPSERHVYLRRPPARRDGRRRHRRRGLWRPDGPTRGAGRAAGVTVHALADDGSAMYAGCSGHGVLRSSDGGTWAAASAGLGDHHVHCLLVAGGGALLAGTGQACSSHATAVHLVGRQHGHGSVADLLVGRHPRRDVARRRLRRRVALDGCAASWAPVPTGLTAAHVFAVAAARGAVYGGTGDGLVRSVDGGRSWTRVDDRARRDAPSTASRSRPTAGCSPALRLAAWSPQTAARRGASENDGLTILDIYALTVDAVRRHRRRHQRRRRVPVRAATGSRWTAANDGLPDRAVHDLVVDADGRLTAATSNLDGGHKGGGVYRWCDGAWIRRLHRGCPTPPSTGWPSTGPAALYAARPRGPGVPARR